MNLKPYAVKDMSTSDPIPEGTYRLRINGFEYNDPFDEEWKAAHPNSDAKNAFLSCDLVVQDETIEDKNGEQIVVFGRHLFTVLTFKKGGDFMLRQLLEAVGKEDDWMLIDDEGQPHWDELKDGEVSAVVTIQPERFDPKSKQTYQARNNVKKIIPLLG